LNQRRAAGLLHDELLRFSDIIDRRGAEELPELNGEPIEDDNGDS
jgi:hypothetical protein